MSRRRELEDRLQLYDELTGILGAMRSFSLAELRRVGRGEEDQRRVSAAVALALADLADALPPPPHGHVPDIWLLLGSVRGFCGGFNEDVLRAWQARPTPALHTIVVGERLVGLMPEDPSLHAVSGAMGTEDAAPTVDRILSVLGKLDRALDGRSGLVVCLRDEDGVRCERLLPLAAKSAGNPLPLAHESHARTATRVAEHYLFHALLALMLRSIHSENHLRLLQMENALRHLERSREDLVRLRNRLRQEEIVEEIELMAGTKT